MRVVRVSYCLSVHFQLLKRLVRLLPCCGREHENLKRFLVGVVMAMNGSELSRVLKDLQDQRKRSKAASVLGSLAKRQPKKWTGWIGQDHFWRGRRVVLPDGRVGEIYGIVRQQAAVRWHDPYALNPIQAALFDTRDLRVYRLPAAVALGHCKSGVRERPSAVKAETSRLNAYSPPRPGSRPRGRPRKRIESTQSGLEHREGD